MSRLFHAIALGLVGAAVVHILVLLLLPALSERDAWARLAERAPLYETVPLSDWADADPLFRTAACRFDLREGSLQVTAESGAPFWSASVYDRAGSSLFSLSDRTLGGRLDFQVLDAGQAAAAQLAQALDPDAPARFRADTDEGVAVIRAFVPDQSWEDEVERFVASFRCATLVEPENS